eukprot:13007240-Alexandrium_andersonii.AAC.1
MCIRDRASHAQARVSSGQLSHVPIRSGLPQSPLDAAPEAEEILTHPGFRGREGREAQRLQEWARTRQTKGGNPPRR